MSTVIIFAILAGLVFVALFALNKKVHDAVMSILKFLWEGIQLLATWIDAPALAVLVGIISIFLAALVFFVSVGYSANWNWLLRPLTFFAMLSMIISIIAFNLRGLSLFFIFTSIILLVVKVDVVLLKGYMDAISVFTLLCLVFVALGVYLEKRSKAPGYFLISVFILVVLFRGYIYFNPNLWKAQKKVLMARRDITTLNTGSVGETLSNDWKFGVVDPKFKVVLLDNDGNFVENPNFPVEHGSKVLVYSKLNIDVPAKVDSVFRGFPVYKIGSPEFTETTYWVLEANVKILKKLKADTTNIQTDSSDGDTGGGGNSTHHNLCPSWKPVKQGSPVELVFVRPHTRAEYAVRVKGGAVKFQNSKGGWDVLSGYDVKKIRGLDVPALCQAYYHSGNPEVIVEHIF